MATKLGIYNLALSRLGQNRLAKINADVENRRKLDNVYDETLGQLLTSGPEKGWKFARKTGIGINRDSSSIAAFSDYSSIVADTTLVTTDTAHTLITGNDAEIDDTSNFDGDYLRVVVISPSQFYLTDTAFSTNDATGTVFWISNNFRYRYRIPKDSLRVTSVNVGGIEITDWEEEEGFILTNMESITVYIDYIKLVTNTGLFPFYFTKVLYLSLAVELSDNITKSVAKTERLEEKLEKAMSKAEGLDEQKKYVREVSTSWVDAGRGSTEGRTINPNFRGDGYTS
ncbi:hypothetical protein LCGC14_0345670 [marine sediment metagenome]|uniref:Uncharacterized protein n=1 Tax=marine sediment metagenome TaxID=412755 RepID=A0A0F9TC27_9ZZZZ